jgi:Protein of unknown function (DUF3179)
MLAWKIFRQAAIATALVGLVGSVSCSRQGDSAKQNKAAAESDKRASIEDEADRESPPRLPETQPPEGLPIVLWGKRDHFPVIRKPQYLTAKQGDRALAPDEPVLGLVIGDEARAYSTNQLNEHEMVIDTIAGTPVLVTY